MSPSLAKHLDALTGFPRPRGDEPEDPASAYSFQAVFPARAGMSPEVREDDKGTHSFPRPRGDEPWTSLGVRCSGEFSPPARG